VDHIVGPLTILEDTNMPFSFGFGNKSVFSKGNKSRIVTDNLVYEIDPSNTRSYPGSGTTVTDISGQGNTATLVNGTAFSSNQFSFDGTNDIINITHSASLNLGQAFTVGMWVRANALGANLDVNRQVLYTTRVNNPAGCWQLELNANTISVTGVGTFVISAGTIAANTWYYIVYRRDGSGSGTIYINGVAQTPSVTTAYTFIDNGDIKQIGGGGSTGTGQQFNGRIGDVHLYKRALAQHEILQNYNATAAKYATLVSTNLVLHLDAGNASSYSGSGTTWTDISGQGNTTTISGATYSASNGGIFTFTAATRGTVTNGSSIIANSNYTKSVWVKFSSLTGLKNLISGSDSSPISMHAFWCPDSWNGYTNKFTAGHNNDWTLVNSTTTAVVDTWYNVTMSFSTSAGMKLYVNGVLQSSNAAATTAFPFATGGPLYLGQYGTNYSNGFAGSLSMAMIYNRALTDAEVAQNYEATKARF
jgi:hypothetical protein